MELEPDRALPPLEKEPNDKLIFDTVHDPGDVFINICKAVRSFVALPLYKHILQHLQATARANRAKWQTELGDWRDWYAHDTVNQLRRWWVDAGLCDVCLTAFELETESAQAPSRPPPTPSPPVTKSVPTARSSASSKWASSSPTPLPASPSPAPTRSPPSTVAPNRRNLSPSKRLRDFHDSLEGLSRSLETHPEDTKRWSSVRFEVLLESVALLLSAVLGGLLKTSIKKEIRIVTSALAKDLRRVGVDIDKQQF
jgi:hypothetical protein